MKSISDQSSKEIEDVMYFNTAIKLPPSVMEKDLLLTEVLQSTLNIESDLKLVFCGGTCLSKARGIIDRMSEDIDFKVIVPEGLSTSAKGKALSHFKKQFIASLSDVGYDIQSEDITARNNNQYIGIDASYASKFAPVLALRPIIKIELTANTPRFETELLPIRTILHQAIGRDSNEVKIECVSVQETAMEKVLSFLRRTAEYRAGRTRGEFDNRLVRHLYDVSAIKSNYDISNFSKDDFAEMVMFDATQFKNQYPEFEIDPWGETKKSLCTLKDDNGEFENYYKDFVNELVFGEEISFNEARLSFVELAESLIAKNSLTQKM